MILYITPSFIDVNKNTFACLMSIMFLAPPTALKTLSVSISIPGQQFTINWNEPPLNLHGRVDTYFLSITGPDDLCGSVNILRRLGNSTRSYTCSGWTMPEGQTYTFTVQPANCGGELRGPESDPVTVSLQGAYFVTLICATAR